MVGTACFVTFMRLQDILHKVLGECVNCSELRCELRCVAVWVAVCCSVSFNVFCDIRQVIRHFAQNSSRICQLQWVAVRVAVCCSVSCSALRCLLECVATCCSVLQCVALSIAACYSVLQCVDIVHKARWNYVGRNESQLQCVAMSCIVSCRVLQCVTVCCSVLQCVAVCYSVLQCVAVCCSVLQCVAVCCSVHNALWCHALPHSIGRNRRHHTCVFTDVCKYTSTCLLHMRLQHNHSQIRSQDCIATSFNTHRLAKRHKMP